MKWFNYGANKLTNDADEVFYSYAYFDFMLFHEPKKSVLSVEVDKGRKVNKIPCIVLQVGGDALFRVSLSVWNLGFDFYVWGY